MPGAKIEIKSNGISCQVPMQGELLRSLKGAPPKATIQLSGNDMSGYLYAPGTEHLIYFESLSGNVETKNLSPWDGEKIDSVVHCGSFSAFLDTTGKVQFREAGEGDFTPFKAPISIKQLACFGVSGEEELLAIGSDSSLWSYSKMKGPMTRSRSRHGAQGWAWRPLASKIPAMQAQGLHGSPMSAAMPSDGSHDSFGDNTTRAQGACGGRTKRQRITLKKKYLDALKQVELPLLIKYVDDPHPVYNKGTI